MKSPERMVLTTCLVGALCLATAQVTEQATEQRIRSERATCPPGRGDDVLLNSTHYPSGAVTCRYGSLRRGVLRERLLAPTQFKST